MFSYNEPPFRYENAGETWYDEHPDREIEVIAHFEKGHIKPLRFRMKNEDGSEVVKIKKAVETWNDGSTVKYVFNFVMDNVKHQWEIAYEIKEMRWRISRID